MHLGKISICILAIAASIISNACEKELDLNLPVTDSQMVVEGWIENGRAAEIILSHSAPFFSAIDSSNLMNFAEKTAKVSIYGNDASEILTLRRNINYFPPYVYVSTVFLGESGNRYDLEIISRGDTITASTTIPEPVMLDSVWFAREPGMENKGRLWIRLSDNRDEQNFYRILYKRKGKDSRYIATNISTFSDLLINGETQEMGFLRGISSMISLDEENYFEVGDTISVKFCAIDEEQFNFWNVYQSKVLASANPLAVNNNILKSNVKGGLGIWTGYGATYYTVYAK